MTYRGKTAVRKATRPSTSLTAGSAELTGVLARGMEILKSDDIRTGKVADIKAQIEAGTYETSDKLDIAVDRLLDELLNAA